MPGKVVDSGFGKHQAQRALMLVESCGLVTFLGSGADDESGDLPATMANIRPIAFIECDDEQAATLKRGIGD